MSSTTPPTAKSRAGDGSADGGGAFAKDPPAQRSPGGGVLPFLYTLGDVTTSRLLRALLLPLLLLHGSFSSLPLELLLLPPSLLVVVETAVVDGTVARSGGGAASGGVTAVVGVSCSAAAVVVVVVCAPQQSALSRSGVRRRSEASSCCCCCCCVFDLRFLRGCGCWRRSALSSLVCLFLGGIINYF